MFLLLAITTLIISNSSLAADPALSQDISVSPGDNDFITITDATLGNFQIQAAPITVAEYAAFLTAVAPDQDPHGLYNDAMKELIAYSPAGLIEDATYSVVSGKENNPITCVSLLDAMRYCNWKENGEMSYEEAKKFFALGMEVTETGAYDFSKTTADGLPEPSPDAGNQLPTADQLIAALPQLSIPEGDFNEWTFSEEAVVPFVISPINGQNQGDTPQQTPAIFLLSDHDSEQPALINTTGTEISASNGFRLVQKIVVIEQATRQMAASEDGSTIGANAGNASQEPSAASNGSTQRKASSKLSLADKLLKLPLIDKLLIAPVIGIIGVFVVYNICLVIGHFFFM